MPPKRPALEVADILHAGIDTYCKTHSLSFRQRRVVGDLMTCRTAALGGFKTECGQCGAVSIQYASCRNRHCPKCQPLSQTRWVEKQCSNLLDIDYWHVVLTLPHELNPLAQVQPALVYGLLFKAASRTLQEFGHTPRWLGGELGITMVLHTWGQNLGQHIHVHCIVTDGGLSPDRKRWISPTRKGFLFPARALSRVFRGKFIEFLDTARRKCELCFNYNDDHAFACLSDTLRSRDWVVYTKPPFAGMVKVMRLTTGEFIRRLLQHVLPKGFTRIRHYGLLANRYRAAKLARCRALLAQREPEPLKPDSTSEMMLRLTGKDITVCDQCGHGPLKQLPIPKLSSNVMWAAHRPGAPP